MKAILITTKVTPEQMKEMMQSLETILSWRSMLSRKS
ncbi:hypothetical protein BH18ACI3_BH18ACI3_01430 [soil metagenome]